MKEVLDHTASLNPGCRWRSRRAIGENGASYATFITGPSRTADIERQLTVGVQGPGVYHVMLVDALS